MKEFTKNELEAIRTGKTLRRCVECQEPVAKGERCKAHPTARREDGYTFRETVVVDEKEIDVFYCLYKEERGEHFSATSEAGVNLSATAKAILSVAQKYNIPAGEWQKYAN